MIQEDFGHRFPNLLVAFLSWGLSKKKQSTSNYSLTFSVIYFLPLSTHNKHNEISHVNR